jgi:hypothetical protein
MGNGDTNQLCFEAKNQVVFLSAVAKTLAIRVGCQSAALQAYVLSHSAVTVRDTSFTAGFFPQYDSYTASRAASTRVTVTVAVPGSTVSYAVFAGQAHSLSHNER